MGSEVTHTHMDTHTQSTCLMDFLWNCLKMLAQSRAGSFVSYMLPFCPHRVWYITEKHNFKLNCNFKVDTPPPPPTPKKRVICSWAAYPLLFASLLLFSTHLIFCVDGLQLWSLNLCTETPLCVSLQGACVTACTGATTLTSLPSPLLHSHTPTHTHMLGYRFRRGPS